MLDKRETFKQFFRKNEPELILTLGVILISLISFAAGRLTAPGLEKGAITIERVAPTAGRATVGGGPAFAKSAFEHTTGSDSLQVLQGRSDGVYVGSKNSDKYHLPSCPGADRIAEHNKIWFNSKEEAESLGYKPAANCPGL